MQQQNAYMPAVSAVTMNAGQTNRTMDWSGEITPPSQMRPSLDTGIGGMSEDMMPSGSRGTQNGMQNQMQNRMQNQMQSSTLDMRNNLPDEVIESPTTNAEVYAGSTKAMLRRNLGNYVVATFLIGTQNTVSWEGVLYDVGNDYVTIYQAGRDRYIVNDIYSLKYMEFYDVRRRQLCDRLMREQGWDVDGNESIFR